MARAARWGTIRGVTIMGVTVMGVTVMGVTVMGVTVMGVTIRGVTIRGVIHTARKPQPTPSAGTTTAMATCTFMPQNADRLTLMQYLSPAFPVGSYAYSQGLEQAITDGHVTDPASLCDWITAILTHGSARMDAILLAHGRRDAHVSDTAPPDTGPSDTGPSDTGPSDNGPPDNGPSDNSLADLGYAYATSSERATEMREQGAAFGRVMATITGHSPPTLPYALAFAHATRTMDLPTEDILAAYLQALTAQLISVAVRFVPLKAADGQKLLTSLGPLITGLATTYATLPLSALSSATLGADLAQMRHETLDVRIYRS